MRIATLLAMALTPVASIAQAPAPSSPAAPAALRWVTLVDTGDYLGSWQTAGTLFRARGDQPGWAATIGAVRQPLGAVSSRVMLDSKHLTTLPGAPDGSYEIIRFASSFAQKRGATETVILADEGGTWKVDGYFVS